MEGVEKKSSKRESMEKKEEETIKMKRKGKRDERRQDIA